MTPGIEDVRKFYDDWVGHLSRETARHRDVYRLLDLYTPPPPCSILDIGCGTGLTSRHMALGGRSVVAVDLSPVLIDYAKRHNDGLGIEYVCADITTWQDDRKFDCVTMVDSLEHIIPSAVPGLMSVLSRASHDNTMAIVHVPHHRWLSFVNGRGTNQPVNELWTMGDIETTFASAGFVPYFFKVDRPDYMLFILVREERFYDAYRFWEPKLEGEGR